MNIPENEKLIKLQEWKMQQENIKHLCETRSDKVSIAITRNGNILAYLHKLCKSYIYPLLKKWNFLYVCLIVGTNVQCIVLQLPNDITLPDHMYDTLIQIIANPNWDTPFPDDFDPSHYGELIKFCTWLGDTTLIDVLLDDIKTDDLAYFMFIQKILNLYSLDRDHKIMDNLIHHLKRRSGKPTIDIERALFSKRYRLHHYTLGETRSIISNILGI